MAKRYHVKGTKAPKPRSGHYRPKRGNLAANKTLMRDSFVDDLEITPANRLPLKPNLPIPPNPQKPSFKRAESGGITWIDSPNYTPPPAPPSPKVLDLQARYRRLAQSGKRIKRNPNETIIQYSFKTRFERTGERSFKPLTDTKPSTLDPDSPPSFGKKPNTKKR
jgi:hypothetical protein